MLKKKITLQKNNARFAEGGIRNKNLYKKSFNGHHKIKKNLINNDIPVTIITATLNNARTLRSTILSVLNQNYINIEYIIIDGGSTDGTLEIIREFDHKIEYWVSEPDDGIYDAWNKGIILARSDWICFLGADDTYNDDAITSYINLLKVKDNKNIQFISSKVNLIKNLECIRTIGSSWNWKLFSKSMNVAHAGSFHHISLFNRYGLYDPSFKICGDYEFLLRARSDLQAEFLDKLTVNMTIGGLSDNLAAIIESEKAKIKSGGRNIWLCSLERFVATLKWKLRKILWY